MISPEEPWISASAYESRSFVSTVFACLFAWCLFHKSPVLISQLCIKESSWCAWPELRHFRLSCPLNCHYLCVALQLVSMPLDNPSDSSEIVLIKWSLCFLSRKGNRIVFPPWNQLHFLRSKDQSGPLLKEVRRRSHAPWRRHQCVAQNRYLEKYFSE